MMNGLIALFIFISISADAQSLGSDQIKQADFNNVYLQSTARGGGQSHQLIVTGQFPNGCYKWLKADVQHVGDFTHEIRGFATVAQRMCIMMIVPFTQQVDLGSLQSGKHTVRLMNGNGTVIEKQFEIN